MKSFVEVFVHLLLLLVLSSLLQATSLSGSSSRLHVHRFTPETGFHGELVTKRGLSSATTTATFKATLHRRLGSSANMTRMERFYHAVQKSKARARALAATPLSGDEFFSTSKASTKATSNKDYRSPVASINGAYTMEIRLGKPPQKFSAIADTGSDLVWVQCKPCVQCYPQNDPVFDPSSSSTFAKESCQSSGCQALPASACSNKSRTCIYGYQYGDSSSTQGDLATETVTLVSDSGGTTGFPGFEFGCGRLNSGSFGGAAGIVGLGQGTLSLPTQLAPSIGNKFSYCLVDFDAASSVTSPLVFGSSASISGSYQSTPIIPNSAKPTYYYVGLEGVSVGGKALSLSTRVVKFNRTVASKKLKTRTLEVNAGGTILDSGTTLTLLDDSVYNKIKSAFSSRISLPSVDGSSAGFDLCYDISSNKQYKFPSLKLALKGADFYPPQKNYFVIVDTAGKVACLAMGGSGSLGLGIIGNIMQQNYQVVYDRGAGVISFAPAKCSSL